MNKITGRIVMMATVAAGLVSPDAGAQFTIKQPETTGTISIEQHNREQLAAIGFRIETDVRALDGKKLQKHLRGLVLETAAGLPVRSFSFHKGRNLVVGTSLENVAVQLNVIKVTATGLDLFVSFRSPQGKFLAVQPDQLGVFTLNGNHRGFSMERFPQSKSARAYFQILIDRSGSMKRVRKQVLDAARKFLAELPNNARCQLISFSDNIRFHSDGFRTCDPDGHALDKIRMGGGTDLQRPLVAAYANLKHVEKSLKAVLILTDGVGSIDKRLVKQHKTAATHVYFLGSYRQDKLDFADTFLFGKNDLKKMLGRYFTKIQNAINNQTVISVKGAH